MRTTLDLSDELLRAAKKRAADERIPLREVVEHALRRYLSGRQPRSGYRLRWSTDRGRVQPGVDLDDRDSLFDASDDRK